MEEVKPKPKRKKSKTYFGKKTEDAIKRFKLSESLKERRKIYEEEIHPVFLILTEKLIHKMKLYPEDMSVLDLQYETIAHLYENGLNRKGAGFNPEKGKAFSYFTRSTFNFLLGKQAELYKRKISKASVIEIDTSRNVVNEVLEASAKEELSSFIDVWCEYYDRHMDLLFKKHKELTIVDAVIALFSTRQDIEIFNKKALYVLIRERSNCNTNEITAVVKVIKRHFFAMYKDYQSHGKILEWYNYQ